MILPQRKSPLFGVLVLTSGAVFAQAPVSSTTQQQTGTIEQRVERLERMLQSQGLLEILQQLQQLQQDINTLRGEGETHNYNLDQLSRRQRDLYADIDQRLQRLEGGSTAPLDVTAETGSLGAETPPLETLAAVSGSVDSTSTLSTQGGLSVEVISNPATGQQVASVAGPAESPSTAMVQSGQTVTGTTQTTLPGQLEPSTTSMQSAMAQDPSRAVSTDPVQLQAEYQQAFNLLRQSLYDQAIKAFQQFLTDHPNDRYSDSAQYWLAETYYVKREFQPALDEYNKVINNFPESQKVSDAMLKIGFTLIELGQLDNAREHLQTLIRQQPDSTVARLADERLKQLGTTPQQTLPAEVN